MNALLSCTTQIATPADMIIVMKKAIDTRIKFEETTQGAAKTIKQLTGLLKKAERMDNFTLSYMIENRVDFDSYVNSSKQSGTRANIYSITKLWELCRVLHGAKFDDMDSNDHATLVATLVGLYEGNVNQKRLQNRIDDLMTGVRRFQMFRSSAHAAKLESYQLTGKAYVYAAGNTQGGSSLRALEALGVVKETGREGTCKTWGFCDDSDSVKAMVKNAFYALSLNMFLTTQDSDYITGTEISPAIPENIVLSVTRVAVTPAPTQEDSGLNAARESLLHSLALIQADSDGMGQAITNVPHDGKEEEETERAPIDILDKEAMAAEAARQKEAKKAASIAKRKATLAAKKAAQGKLI